LLLEVLQKSRKEYQGQRAAAEALLTIGSSKPDPSVDVVEHAAWTMVARVLFNLSEMNTRN
jgi:hypothetical protein